MSFFAVLFALLLEQLKPLPRQGTVNDTVSGWMRWAGLNFNAGKAHHAWVVWVITALVPAVLACGVWLLLHHFSILLALAWNVAVLYLTLGFRQFSHFFTDIRDAMERGEEDRARTLLSQWRHVHAADLSRHELLGEVIEHSLLAAHRHVFGVFFWFVVLSSLGLGPAGAVLYRLSEFASRYWAHKSRNDGLAPDDGITRLSRWLFSLLDHVPARLTASGFAVVGNFEEAITCWRRDATLWETDNEGVILASAAGAIGVRLGVRRDDAAVAEPVRGFQDSVLPDTVNSEGSTTGAPPELHHLRSVVGLVWRSVVLWMLLLALLSLANLVG
jgi:adenosylcobinamide-phosphate synthase